MDVVKSQTIFALQQLHCSLYTTAAAYMLTAYLSVEPEYILFNTIWLLVSWGGALKWKKTYIFTQSDGIF